MAKALLGTHATPSSLRLLDEIRALRARVADLERALAEAEAAGAARAAAATSGADERAAAEGRQPATT